MTIFLPVTKEEMLELGWQQCDFAFVSADTYVDHPFFCYGSFRSLAFNSWLQSFVIMYPSLREDVADEAIYAF